MAKVHSLRPPTQLAVVRIFLAGSIDNGTALDWQTDITNRLKVRYQSRDDVELIICNPRRDNWNMDPSNDELEFQINWELTNIETADVVAVYFASNSQSPVTMLETGLLLGTYSNMILHVPDDFWRATNLKVTAARYGFPVSTTESAFFGRLTDAIDIVIDKQLVDTSTKCDSSREG